jgi:protocatechuate 3,4-dioxygenase beta subunit
MSNNKVEHHHILLRRDTLKLCLVPIGAYATRLLGGCSDAKKNDGGMQPSDGSGGNTVNTGSGGAAPYTTSQPGSGGSSSPGSGVAGTQPSTGTGGSASPVTGSGGMQASNGTGGKDAIGKAPIDAGTDAGGSDVAGPGTPWATGGTKTITGNYPDPFMDDPGAACAVYPAQTIGPCYAQGPEMREDISDGLDGLPIRLSFLVVKADGCTPVPNAGVDIWHSGSAGIYSAYAMGTVCNPGSDNVLSDMFCRGVQTTDENGRVDFSTVFPGWYTGRTIHIHFTIRIGGQEYVTSQLYFEDALSDEILAQGQYAARGKRDTTNANDNLFSSGGATAEQVLFETAKRPDGVLHAWKVLSIHS